MKTRLVPIGNSQDIVIPKRILEQIGLRGEVEVSVEGNSLVIRAARKPRQGWAAAFRKMAQRGEDALLDEATPSLSTWDETEWEWE
jgi:antitoxin MazE